MRKYLTILFFLLLIPATALATSLVKVSGVKVTAGTFVDTKAFNKYYVDDNGLMSWYGFDEGASSTAHDWGLEANNGTFSGTATGTNGYFSPGKVGQFWAAFDGTTTELKYATNTPFQFGTSSFTVSAG